jgi:hypothetical protein
VLALAQAVKLLSEGFCQMALLIGLAILIDLGISLDIKVSNLPYMMRSPSTLRHMVPMAREHSVKKFATVLDNGSHFAMAFNQGERAPGLGRLIKETMSWYDFDTDCVTDIRLDSDTSRKTDTDVAGALHSSLKQVDKYQHEEKISKASGGQCSDSGGGGTIELVAEALRLVDRVDDFAYQHVSA